MGQAAEQYYSNYTNAGFYFPNSVLTTYALSLASKPFVILSGISGTGKTKIAQLFEVPSIINNSQNETVSIAPKLSIKVTEDFGRFNFFKESLPNLLNEDEIEDWEKRAADFVQRNNNGNFTETYVITINDEHGSFQLGFYGQRAASPLVRGRFFKSNQDKINSEYDAREHLKTNYKPGDVLELNRISDKNYEVASVNDVQIRKKQTELEVSSLERKCFISVRSDWTDNNELLGYYNLIEKKYHIPSFLEFVLTAKNYPEYPFFVILDEMNLSKVEHYFSDILSCSESRIKTDDGVIQESIMLHNGTDRLETDSETFENIQNSIEIPLNLYITGTVNIDESTYSFSSKVLDRANVIEFNDVNLVNYGGGQQVQDDSSFKLSTFPDFLKYEVPAKKHYDSLNEEIKKYLVDLNDILKTHNLHFGYRIANEIGLFIQNTSTYIGTDLAILKRALDYQLIQKVFPKLNGEFAILEEPLREVLQYLSKTEDIHKINSDATEFPNTIAKLERMYKKLSKTGYATFIE